MKDIIKQYKNWICKGNKLVKIILSIVLIVPIILILILLPIFGIIAFLRKDDKDAEWKKCLKFILRMVIFVLFYIACLFNEWIKNNLTLDSYNFKIMFLVAIAYFFILPILSCKIYMIHKSYKEALCEQAVILLLVIVLYKASILFLLENPTESNYFDVISWGCTFVGMLSLLK